MSNIVQNLLNEVLQDGARPTKYKCQVIIPSALEPDDYSLNVICKSAIFPSKTTEVIMLKYKGRTIPIPGQEKYGQTIDLGFYLEESHKTKTLFDAWSQALNYDNYNDDIGEGEWLKQDIKDGASTGRAEIQLTQLDFAGEKDRIKYTFYDVFPKEVSAVNMSSESVGAILDYTVSFSYSYYRVDVIDESGNVSNNILNTIQDTANSAVQGAMDYLFSEDNKKAINKNAAETSTTIQNKGRSVGGTLDNFFG